MNGDYKIIFKADQYGARMHKSYLTALENNFTEAIKSELRKHKHACGEYTAFFRVLDKKNPKTTNKHILLFLCNSISAFVTDKNGMTVIILHIDFLSDNMVEDPADKRCKWIDVSEDISEYSPQFKIHNCYTLPSEVEFEEQSRRAAEKFIKSFNSFRFPCELSECDFPDVIYEIQLEECADESTAENAFAVIEKWADNYNRRKKDGDCAIHFVQRLENKDFGADNDSLLVHIDFGECDVLLIRNVINQLNKSELPIKRIVIR